MRPKLWTAYPLLATAVLLTTTGCEPAPSPPPAHLSDLCSTLPIADVQTTYRRLTPTLLVTKQLDPSELHPAGMASCHYGPKDHLGGLVLSVPIGGPVPEVANLIGGRRARNSQDVTVDSDKAFFVRGETESAIAVDHGSTQFVLTWTPLLGAPNEMVTQQQLVILARIVAKKLPTDFVPPQQDIAPECTGVRVAEHLVGGKVVMARGTVNNDTLNCNYLGPTGILRADAAREADHFVDDQIRILRSGSRNLIDPPVSDDTALMALSATSMYIQGYLTDCCTVQFEHRAVNDAMDYSSEFDSAQREFVSSFIAAARSWSHRR
ncbi:hypothetical protein C0J29_24655 [Mycobacterium paragordonae]|uniref:DUF3558 domain-containing protein n=2 Tax=Mycobacterium paragordonae TaxID=1389713 RepID=A0ABQ1CA45_9MYCO|nr:hypothetical protein C0J29_24655 [Mycobacterium paragordonae]GFG81182.1 hypothetical protein MPRG_44580 [Mycobacterium paragordonae]